MFGIEGLWPDGEIEELYRLLSPKIRWVFLSVYFMLVNMNTFLLENKKPLSAPTMFAYNRE